MAKGQTAVLLPGTHGAEPWELWLLRGQGQADMVQACKTPAENRLRKSSTLLLPITYVYCVPLWLNETDAKQFAGMIPLQLEMRGLQPRGGEPAVFDWTVVTQEGARTLVAVGVLPAALPAEFNTGAYQGFDLSARYLPLPENALVIWREQDRLVLAITRGAFLVYFQALTEGTVTPRVVQEIICAQATLAMQDVVGPLGQIVAWTPLTEAEVAALKGALPLPVVQEDRPVPSAPKQAWKLVPVDVNEARRLKASRAWLWRAAGIFLVAYLAFVGFMVWQHVTLSRQADALRHWRDAHAEALDLVESGRAQWKALAPVVETKDYPLELLRQTVESIPADQLHLTLFEAGNGKLRIKGEAKNVAGAFEFFGKLKGDPYFSTYHLEMANPNPLPNDLAAFQIEGSHGGD